MRYGERKRSSSSSTATSFIAILLPSWTTAARACACSLPATWSCPSQSWGARKRSRSARQSRRDDPVRLQPQPQALAVLRCEGVEPGEVAHALEAVRGRGGGGG